jgi:alkylation response protein AidB-like acyl-CoA dehydrogenase
MVGPVIYTFGNEEQKERFLPDILNLILGGAKVTQNQDQDLI